MLARPFWCMVVARLMQGVASAVVWNVGMAMICENVDDNVVGRQLGYAMSGLAVGTSIGPVIDFIGRLLVIERKDLPAQCRQTLSASTDKANTDAAAQTKINETDDVKDHTLFTNAPPEDKTITFSPYELQATTSRTSAPTAPPKQLGPLEVLVQLGRSPRALTAFGLEFTYAIIMAALEPTLTLRVQSVWHKDAFFIGIIYLVAAVPTFFTGPIAGAMADKWGSEVLTIPLLVLCLPLPPLLILKQSLPGFIIILTFAMALEVAMVAKTQEGIGEIHQIGGMNMAYGLGQSTSITCGCAFTDTTCVRSAGACIGPIISGQIYDHVGGGWNVLSWAYMGILAINLIPVFLYTGQRPWAKRLFGRDTGTGRGEKVGDTKEVDNKHTDSSIDVA
ncbi:hypothetical protein QFC21_005713 [Naganishia friedmannii]|uniref:Uncharacterized protein n=1 Tax=Naganishia friedmannii TaxID=89922 RepID=A0ACC2V7S9_9TREE|nr:hypothetical protein QFC21_005713 [Naganishia friedmannii]